MTDPIDHNRKAWNADAASGQCRWSQPVDRAAVARARNGEPDVYLTPNKAVPLTWFEQVEGIELLGLASGGGQQMPLFAAAGARVTSLDLSDEQLALDAKVAEREGLAIEIMQGRMDDLSRFDDSHFHLIFHPCSNMFAPDVRAVWRECHRVLRPGGRLLSGFMNPDYYLFDHEAMDAGAPLTVTFPLPYADISHLPKKQLAAKLARNEPLEFSHSLDDLIGGQLDTGFSIIGFYEDRWDDAATPLDRFMPTTYATLAIKGI